MSQRIGACYPPLMSLAAGVLGALVQVQNLAAAAVLAAFFALALRSLGLLFLDRGCGSVLLPGRVVGTGRFLAGGAGYRLVAAPRLVGGPGGVSATRPVPDPAA